MDYLSFNRYLATNLPRRLYARPAAAFIGLYGGKKGKLQVLSWVQAFLPVSPSSMMSMIPPIVVGQRWNAGQSKRDKNYLQDCAHAEASMRIFFERFSAFMCCCAQTVAA